MPLDQVLAIQSCAYDELHARPFMDIPSPARIFSVTVFFDSDTGQQHRNLCRLIERFGLSKPPVGARSYTGHVPGLSVHWSLHTEFARYTVAMEDGERAGTFTVDAGEPTRLDWLEDLDGTLLTASLLILTSEESSSVISAASGGKVSIGAQLENTGAWLETDMQLRHAAGCDVGFVRYRVGIAGMGPEQTGRFVQRIVEIETYLALTLVSLPIARDQVPELDRIGVDLRALVVSLGDAEQGEDVLLHKLEGLAADLERLIAISQYRFSASHAYFELVDARLAEFQAPLRQGSEPLRDFVLRRLNPAMATCRAVGRRQEGLAVRVERAAALLRARQEARHQQLNRALLARTAKNGELQVRLQETVEGLSIWVLTYYVTGLGAYLLKALHGLGYDFDYNVILGIGVPFVAAVIWMALRMAKKNLAECGGGGTVEPRTHIEGVCK